MAKKNQGEFSTNFIVEVLSHKVKTLPLRKSFLLSSFKECTWDRTTFYLRVNYTQS